MSDLPVILAFLDHMSSCHSAMGLQLCQNMNTNIRTKRFSIFKNSTFVFTFQKDTRVNILLPLK